MPSRSSSLSQYGEPAVPLSETLTSDLLEVARAAVLPWEKVMVAVPSVDLVDGSSVPTICTE
ncbi:hypothetical protein D9M70_563970 [compost metagenome]